jgi:hypothetical protein
MADHLSPASVLHAIFMSEDWLPNPNVRTKAEGDTISRPAEWALYKGFIPAVEDSTDRVTAVYDTAGGKDGRIMGGSPLFHPGLQFRCRSDDYDLGYAKLEQVQQRLASLNRKSITIEDVTYMVTSFNQSSSILSIGVTVDSNRRFHNFSLNGQTTIVIT